MSTTVGRRGDGVVDADSGSPLQMTAMSRSASDTTASSSSSFSSSSHHCADPFPPQSSSFDSPFSPSNPYSPSYSPHYSHSPPSSSSTASSSSFSSSPSPYHSSPYFTPHYTSTVPPFSLFESHRCPLCNFSSTFDPSLPHTCTRCGLSTLPSHHTPPFSLTSPHHHLSHSPPTPPSSSIMQEAAAAYRFHLLSRMSPLLSDLSRIVVDYLLWYRDPQSFHVGDRVDVQDVRGQWCRGQVRAVEGEEVRVGYEGWSKKWDQWIEVRSERLAPCGTKTKAVGEAEGGGEGDR